MHLLKKFRLIISILTLINASKALSIESEHMYLISLMDLESEKTGISLLEKHPSISFISQILIKREIEKFSDEITEIAEITKDQTIEIEQYQYNDYRFFLAKKGSLVIAMVTSPGYPNIKMMEFLYNVGMLQEMNESNRKALYLDVKRLYNQFQTIEPSIIQELLVKVENTKEVMQININKLLDNGEKIEHLAVKAEETEELARIFHKTAKKVKRNQCLSLWCCGCLRQSHKKDDRNDERKNQKPSESIKEIILRGIASMKMER